MSEVGHQFRRPGLLAWLRLARVFQKIEHGSTEHLRQWDLSVAQFDVIAQVGSAEGIMQQELADRLLVTKGNVSQLLDRLERRGLICRCPDGRTQRLSLTPTGRTLYHKVVPEQERYIGSQFAALSVEEQRHLHDLLQKLDRSLSC
ncbi:MAG TPA: MarR family winged helix-turn-helix transcriptional regulator [Ktedonobacterales bacterium]|nr:MarR family winged helix-turn-helix transcriptional regulator [Ktedonobacterales bacterium]